MEIIFLSENLQKLRFCERKYSLQAEPINCDLIINKKKSLILTITVQVNDSFVPGLNNIIIILHNINI